VKVYVVGAGAVGLYLGSALESIGNEVVYAPRALDAVTPVDVDLAIVAVKAYDTPSAVATLRRALVDPSRTAILCPQNGVGNEEKLIEAFGADPVVAAALTVPVERGRDGASRPANRGGLVIAPVGAKSHNWILAAFGSSGMTVQAADDWRALKWSKLAINIVANATCAILNVLPDRLVHFEGAFALEVRAIRECRAVMRALRVNCIDLPGYPVRALQAIASLPSPVARLVLGRRIARGRGSKPPSLLLDLRAAKNVTEVSVLNGAIATIGRTHGVPTPVNATLARVVEDVSAMPALWAKYRERPSVLEAEVAAERARTARAVHV